MKESMNLLWNSPDEMHSGFHLGLAEGNRLYRRHLNPAEPENHLSSALNAYARALEEVPDSASVLCRMAQVFLKQGDYAKAEQYAGKALKQIRQIENQTGKKPHENAHQPALSGKECRAVLREAYYVMGFIYNRSGEYAQARKAYHLSIRADFSGSSRARLGYFQTICNQPLKMLLSYRGILEGFAGIYGLISSAIFYAFDSERFPLGALMLITSQMLLAWGHEETGAKETAMKRYLQIHEQFPGFAIAGILIGHLFRETNDPDKARFWFEKVIDRHPARLESYYQLATLAEEKEDFSGLIALYEKLIRLRPNNPHLYCSLANAHYHNHAFKEALRCYEAALQLGADSRLKAMVAQSIGNIWVDYLNKPQVALGYYRMANALDSSDLENYIQMGMIYFQKEDYLNAELVYRKAMTLEPNNPRLYSNLGYLRWLESDVENALLCYQKAIELDADYEIPINNMGVIYLDMVGNIADAMKLFQRAIEIDPHYALAYYNLGRAHSFLGQRMEAANCFRTAQGLNHISHELDNDELTERINHLFDICEMELHD